MCFSSCLFKSPPSPNTQSTLIGRLTHAWNTQMRNTQASPCPRPYTWHKFSGHVRQKKNQELYDYYWLNDIIVIFSPSTRDL